MTKIALILLTLLFFSCNEYTPKPSGYARVDREPFELTKFENPYFSFLYPSTATIEKVEKEDEDGIWFNINYPQYNTVIYCTYLPIDKKGLSKALDDSYQLAYSHASKAEGISQIEYADSLHRTSGTLYDIKGVVAVPIQFYITDSVTNFLRGSLYFNQVIESDSVAPIREFMREDIVRIIESLQWGNAKIGKR